MQKDPIHGSAIGLKRKKAAHMAVQGETAVDVAAVSPCVLQSSALSETAGPGLEQPQRLLLCLRLFRRIG